MKKWNYKKWCDEWILAGRGILLATREKRFWVGFVVAFLVFGTLMNLLAGGISKFQLMWASGAYGSLKIILDAIVGTLGIGRPVVEWLPTFALAVLQGALIGLIALLWHKKRAESVENVQKAGIITGLIALGAGCPTCGTTLLTPLLGTIFSTGSLAAVGAISSIVTVLAVVIAVLSLKRIGLEAYVIIVNEKYLKKKAKAGVGQAKAGVSRAGAKADRVKTGAGRVEAGVKRAKASPEVPLEEVKAEKSKKE